jgi:hypothetical protein
VGSSVPFFFKLSDRDMFIPHIGGSNVSFKLSDRDMFIPYIGGSNVSC